ncbi:OLC1v1013814C1 [Oldenlandia corymbosa var. corymbosa]|uniref:Dirigent protein n=1 Tax=Oldenlandia corymbosa var. corymbosa TaxID=529605 RepID=A0AAV1DZ67_OLDCO|nr:OLC1v1013814C1 [Oldenlandia corymbosa var. corymbosa]
MMMRLVALLLLAITISAAQLGHGLIDDQSPEGVQKWFEEFPDAKPKLTKLHFYLNDIASKKPPMSAPVAQAESTATSPTNFGLVTVMDGALTDKPSGKVIGRAQGLFTFSSQEELSALVTLNFVFTDGEFSGSTLSVLGRNPIMQAYRELPVIGGSGAFRLARGMATAKTYYQNVTAGDDIVEVQMVLYRNVLPGQED